MPVYCYRCACGATKEVVRAIAGRNDPVECDPCFLRGVSIGMVRDLTAETLGSSDLPYDVPVESNAMAMNPNQVEGFKRLHPNIEVNREGQVVLRSHRERKRVMKELGFHDRDGY